MKLVGAESMSEFGVGGRKNDILFKEMVVSKEKWWGCGQYVRIWMGVF